MSDISSTAGGPSDDLLAASYNDVPYTSAPSPARHPERLATIGRLLGLDVAPVANARVLELACGDGASLVAIAGTLPRAHFVGIDFAAQPLARARRMADETGVANVELIERDIRHLPPDLGRFDYIVAHGLYSWVPDDVRAHVLPAIARHLGPTGVAYVSYNTLPGSYMRAIVWDMLKYHTREITGKRAKLAPARALLDLVATPVASDNVGQQAMRGEVRDAARSSDPALAHDDLSEPNVPVHFHAFAADAARAGLVFMAEAHLHAMTAGLAPEVRDALSRLDRLAREQYLDFIHFRRFRESLVCHADALSRFVVEPARALELHALPSLDVRIAAARGEQQPMNANAAEIVALLLERWPQSVPVAEIDRGRKTRGALAASSATERLVIELYAAGMVELRTAPVAVASAAGERPQAFAAARWLTREHEVIPSLYHAALRYSDPLGRALLARLDGSRTRAELCAELGGPFAGAGGSTRLERALSVLAAKALLVA